MEKTPQNYANHHRFVPGYHYVLFFLILATLIGSIVNLFNVDASGRYSASLLVAVSVALIMSFYYLRVFALKAQDRAIRAEENLRHYVRTGNLLDSRLSVRQIIGLRFAGDEEYDELLGRAVSEDLGEKEIKQAVRNWRADLNRV